MRMMTINRKKIFSGIQPTGHVTIGNYIGAIQNWVRIQHDYQSIFCIMDLHALTNNSHSDLQENIHYIAAIYIASGLDPDKVTIFQQSHVSQHTELFWILSCITPSSWLNKMTQFKNKAVNNKTSVNLGLYLYPVLMAADILLYNAHYVPVGKDQIQHVELVRKIAKNFNKKAGKKIFEIPEILINDIGARIMSLQDPNKKMSKSDSSDLSRINMSDSSDCIRAKIQKAVSDTNHKIEYDPNNKPGISNLLEIYCTLNDISMTETVKMLVGKNNVQFKKMLANSIIQHICPIHERAKALMEDNYIRELIMLGSARASKVAKDSIANIKSLLGI